MIRFTILTPIKEEEFYTIFSDLRAANGVTIDRDGHLAKSMRFEFSKIASFVWFSEIS